MPKPKGRQGRGPDQVQLGVTLSEERKEPVEVVELASIGFGARGLAYDGTRFWTCDRAANTIVAFARPDL